MRTYKFEVFTAVIEKQIREGILKPGQKLPSIRDLKDQYQTSISTIQNGYEYLVIRGLVDSIPKSGYYVRSRPDLAAPQVKTKKLPVVRDAIFKHHLGLTTSLRTMQQVIRAQGANLLRYYPPGGSIELKNQIIKRAVGYQTIIDPAELLITDGALQALYIALASVRNAGDVIALESPCVFSVLEVIRVLQLKVIEIPVDLQTGFDVDFLKKACQNNTIKAVVITPNFHNPTGLSLMDDQKQNLLVVARHYHIPIIENDIYGDLNFSGQRPSTIKSLDDSGLVLSYSSYAKTLAPGLRLGWLAAGKFTQRAEQIKFALGSTVSPVYQETLTRLLSGTSYDRHVRAFRMQLARNAYLAISLLTEHFPEKTVIATPSGGYNLWVKLPKTIDMPHFYQLCEKIGIRFTPGYTFSFSGAFDKHFRLVFADKFSTKKIEAIKLAGQQLEEHLYR
eukprot:gene16439-19760_t